MATDTLMAAGVTNLLATSEVSGTTKGIFFIANASNKIQGGSVDDTE